MSDFRVFLSAVTSEFGSARDTLAASLRSRDLLLRVQSDFRQEAAADTTLRKLHDYIRGSAVVCVLGKRSGAMPPTAAATPFAHMLPAGITEASYTQWEFFFARHYKRRLSLYIATDAWTPDKPSPADDRADLQRALIRHIEAEQGLDRNYFGDVHHLCHLVLKQDWPREKPPKPIFLPYPTLGTLFKGRDDVLATLRQRLLTGAPAAITARYHALHGLGGIGKTRAAVEYAWAHEADYTALLFAIGETPDALASNMAALASVLSLPGMEGKDDETRLNAVLGWLRGNPGWLLILDNVDTDEAMRAATALMGRLIGGNVLLTTRMRRLPRGLQSLELDVLAPNEAAAYLLEDTPGRRTEPDDAAQALLLAEDLGRLALALTHAAGYIQEDQCSLQDYRARLHDSFDAVIGWFDQTVTHYPRAIPATWALSFARLTPPARALLERLAWLAPDPVPESLLAVPVPDTPAEDTRRALADLASWSLVTRDSAKRTFTTHRLVLDVTRRGLINAGTDKPRLTQALAWVNAAFIGDPQDVLTWPVLDPLTPHVEAVAGYADAAGIVEPTVTMIGALAMLFRVKGLHRLAEPHSRRALAIAEENFPPTDPRIATRLTNLALIMRATNRLDEAEPLMRRALAIDEANYGNIHPIVARDLNNLATLLQHANRRGEAEPLIRRVVAIFEENDDSDIATALNNLAVLLLNTQRLGEAEPLMRRALAIDEATYGSDHPKVAHPLSNLAQLLQATNRVGEAEPLIRRALAIFEASYGKDHPSVAIRLGNLALLLQATDRLGEAEPLMRRCLAIFLAFQRDTGHVHPHRDAAIGNYSALLEATGKSEAEIGRMLRALWWEVGLKQGWPAPPRRPQRTNIQPQMNIDDDKTSPRNAG